jgi:hypothetical protein
MPSVSIPKTFKIATKIVFTKYTMHRKDLPPEKQIKMFEKEKLAVPEIQHANR